jgi:hypothetical protein
VTFAIGHGIAVIVVDTASRWFGFKGDEENQSAIEGAADAIIHLTRPTGHDPEVRQLEAIGRFDMPERLLIRRKVQLPHSTHPSALGVVKVEPRYIFKRVIPAGEAESPAVRVRLTLLAKAKTIPEISEATGLPVHTVPRAIKDLRPRGGGSRKGRDKEERPDPCH